MSRLIVYSVCTYYMTLYNTHSTIICMVPVLKIVVSLVESESTASKYMKLRYCSHLDANTWYSASHEHRNIMRWILPSRSAALSPGRWCRSADSMATYSNIAYIARGIERYERYRGSKVDENSNSLENKIYGRVSNCTSIIVSLNRYYYYLF